MRLPTVSSLKYQTQLMSTQYDKLSRLQIQASTGKKLLQSSDDPVLADKIRAVSDYIDQLDSYNLNITLAETRVSDKEAVAKESIDLNIRANELLLRAQSDTSSNADRKIIADEIQSILNRQLELANTQDASGQYIYSGLKTNTPPFVNQGGVYVYQGTDESMQIPIGSNNSINYTESGFQVFGAIPTGNGSFAVSANAQANTGSGILTAGTVVNKGAYIPDNYTVTVVTNNSGQLAYQIVGANSGQVVPALPASSPADAPAYIPGSDIIFNGMSVQLSGQPAVGDTFNINPSQNQNVFTTLSNMVQVLQTPVDSDKTRADLQQSLGQISDQLSQISQSLLAYESQVGGQGNAVDNQKLLTDSLITSGKIELSKLSDADLSVVLSDLTTQMTLLELTQQTYLKIQECYYSILMNN